MNRKALALFEVMVVAAFMALFVAILLPVVCGTADFAEPTLELGSVVMESNMDNSYLYLPLAATNIKEYGNDWWEFTLNGNRWMFHTSGLGQESLVLIPKESTEGVSKSGSSS